MRARLMILSLGVLMAGGVLAQAPQPVQSPTLSMTEKVALQSISEKMKAVQEQTKAVRDALAQVEVDIAKAHPGFHLNEANGELEKDAGIKPIAPTTKAPTK